MKVILEQIKQTRRGTNGRKRVKSEFFETIVLEDDGTEDAGRQVGTFRRHDEAEAVAAAMGWEITDNNRVDGE